MLLLLGCTAWHPPLSTHHLETTAPLTWDEVLARPGEVLWTPHTSARWKGKREGLINFDHELAADLQGGKMPIVLTVHHVAHPDGDWIVDTGISLVEEGRIDGGRLANIAFRDGGEVVEPLEDILEGVTLKGAALTHKHADHVLGVGALPDELPIITGPDEWTETAPEYAAFRHAYKGLLQGKTVRELDLEDSVRIGEFQCWDLTGDGGFWALYTPGHTPGSLSFLVNGPDQEVLLVGDTSHTWWGWDAGVEPGGFTDDHELNRQSLWALKRLEVAYDLQVEVGHEPSRAEPRRPGSEG
ncbi:MAG TPA: MBL fold metallo-hydrolase [Myxococcota bacterium]|nr:MBL fold metallo-hydrolase [Myxococcota bacterium]